MRTISGYVLFSNGGDASLMCDIESLVQDCSNSSTLALDLLQSRIKPSI